METGTLSSKGQVTIPKKIRDFLNIQTAEKLIFTPLDDGKVLLTTEYRSATTIFGLLKHKQKKTPVSIEQMNKAIEKRRHERAGK